MLGLIHNLPFLRNINNSPICHSPRKIDLDGGPCHFVNVIDEYQDEYFERCLVNSFHHQAIDYDYEKTYFLKRNVKVMGTSLLGYDNERRENLIVELMRALDNSWLSCQWHPENDYEDNQASSKILQKFMEMIVQKRTGKWLARELM